MNTVFNFEAEEESEFRLVDSKPVVKKTYGRRFQQRAPSRREREAEEARKAKERNPNARQKLPSKKKTQEMMRWAYWRRHVQQVNYGASLEVKPDWDELATLDGDLVDDDEDFAAPEASKSASALAPETLFFEGPPSITELVLPAISIITIIGVVPFLAAAARQVWVKYKITSRRISVQSGLGGNDFTEIIYSDIVDLKYVYRGSKEVGDMVIELRDGAKLEMRHVPKFQDIYKYIYSLCSEECQATAASMK